MARFEFTMSKNMKKDLSKLSKEMNKDMSFIARRSISKFIKDIRSGN